MLMEFIIMFGIRIINILSRTTDTVAEKRRTNRGRKCVWEREREQASKMTIDGEKHGDKMRFTVCKRKMLPFSEAEIAMMLCWIANDDANKWHQINDKNSNKWCSPHSFFSFSSSSASASSFILVPLMLFLLLSKHSRHMMMAMMSQNMSNTTHTHTECIRCSLERDHVNGWQHSIN